MKGSSFGKLTVSSTLVEKRLFSHHSWNGIQHRSIFTFLSLSLPIHWPISFSLLHSVSYQQYFDQMVLWSCHPEMFNHLYITTDPIYPVVHSTHLPECFQTGLSAESALKPLTVRETSVTEFRVELLSTSQLAQ